ncbi:MAG: hypothetical protein J5953_10920 [Prevotella sp.]|nr:hypothetical protein [Prevotella sp.]
MKIDKYPKIEEEQSEGIMSEPAVSAASLERQSSSKSILPVGLPRNVKEALADIEEGEREFEHGETYSHKEVMKMVWSQIDSYAG